MDTTGNPLENVCVTFSSEDTSVYTDTAGHFVFNKKDVPLSEDLSKSKNVHLILNNKSFSLSLPESHMVDISIYNIRGQRTSILHNHLNGGMHTINFPDLSAGYYIMHISVDSEYLVKSFITTGWSITSQPIQGNLPNSRFKRNIIDTITFKFSGFNDSARTIESYSGDIDTLFMTNKLSPDSSPVIYNLKMRISESGDSVAASYLYTHIYPEGESVIKWYRNDVLINTGNKTCSIAEFENNDSISLEVVPVAVSETNIYGDTNVIERSIEISHFPYIYNGVNNENATSVVLADTGYLIMGYLDSSTINSKDIYMLKIKENGDTIWTKKYGGQHNDLSKDILPVDDGYIIAGSTQSYGAGSVDIWLLKIDHKGDTLWTKTYGGADYETAEAIVNADTGYIIVGQSLKLDGVGNDDFLIMKIDDRGDTAWTRTYGELESVMAASVIPAKDGYIIIGTISTGNGMNDHPDIYLLKVNLQGDSLWTKVYGGTGPEVARKIIKAEDGYILVGRTYETNSEYDAWVLKINESGDTLWTKTFGISETDGANSITKAEGGYIISGYSYSPGADRSDVLVSKIDENGKTLWMKTYAGTGDEKAIEIISTDNGYLIIGTSNTAPAGQYDYDIFTLKITETGDLLKIVNLK